MLFKTGFNRNNTAHVMVELGSFVVLGDRISRVTDRLKVKDDEYIFCSRP